MNFALVAAVDKNRGIGKNNTLPWHLSADLKHFARVTKGGTVIMGRKTWESLPEKYRPLKERKNVVLSTDANYPVPAGVELVQSLDEALSKGEGELFVIGGARLFEEAIHHANCKKIILTEIDSSFDCDAFFPEIPSDFKVAEESPIEEEGGLKFRFLSYERT